MKHVMHIETKDNDGNTPINNASKNGHLETIKYLYESCHVNVDIRDKYKQTSVFLATVNGHIEAAKYLCETCHCKYN